MGAPEAKVWDALMRLETRFDPQNPKRPKSLSGFWFGPSGRCTETYCFVASRWNIGVAREVARRIAAEIRRWYGYTAGSPRKTIHSFNAWSDTGPATIYHLAVSARTELDREMLEEIIADPSTPEPQLT